MSKHGMVIEFDSGKLGQKYNLAKPPERLFAVNAKEEGGKKVAEMLMYDIIGQDWMGEGLTAKRVEDELRNLGEVDELIVLINTPGGVIYEALGIYNALVRFPANVITHNVGAAWSCGGWILQAGDERLTSENATTMIHNSQGFAMGDRRTFEKEAEVLDVMDGTIAATFARRTGRKAETFRTMMDEEAWFTGQEALDAKLVDRVVPAKSGAKNLDPKVYGFNGRKPEQPIIKTETNKAPSPSFTDKSKRARLLELELEAG